MHRKGFLLWTRQRVRTELPICGCCDIALAEELKAETDGKAKKLTDELVSIRKAEAELQASYVPKLSKVLPPIKVARYLQIENKIRAVIHYELAAEVPLVR